MTSAQAMDEAASRLRKAGETSIPCRPVRDLIGSHDLQAAYKVQLINHHLMLQYGTRAVGKKIGLTSRVVQHQLGVDQPDYGMLYGTRQIGNGEEVKWKELMQPKIEAEVAFIMGGELIDGDLTLQDVEASVEYAVASLEIVGSRIENWNIRITDTIADNASASHFVLGSKKVTLKDIDMVNCQMTMLRNGTEVSQGSGANCLGSPLNALFWLARTMANYHQPLKSGDIVLSGALGAMAGVSPGDYVTAGITGLGSVSVQFGK